MKIAIRYCTKTGNTKKLALAIQEVSGVKAEDVSVPLTEDVDILFLGSSVYAAGVDESVKQFMANNKVKIGKIVNFSTAAILKSTYGQIQKLANAKGITMAEEEFYCKGSFKFMHKGRPNADDLENIKAFAKKIIG